MAPAEFDWKTFDRSDVINEDNRSKSIALKLKNGSKEGDIAVALMERLPLERDTAFGLLREASQSSEQVFHNDIYYTFMNKQAGFECRLVYPATEAHVAKYTEQERRMVHETPEQHRLITRPFWKALCDSGQIAWVDNILLGKKEADRVLLNTDDIMLLFDTKWTDHDNVQGLYLLGLFKASLLSVRDLDGSSVELLERVRAALQSFFATEPYKFPDGRPVLYENLRIYFHYPPTYPHLHLHVTLITGSAIGNASVGQAILLDDVIENLRLDHLYYMEHRTLTFQMGVGHALFKQLCPDQ